MVYGMTRRDVVNEYCGCCRRIPRRAKLTANAIDVVTEDGIRVSMWEAEEHLCEEPEVI
jgi:hypothetical protein